MSTCRQRALHLHACPSQGPQASPSPSIHHYKHVQSLPRTPVRLACFFISRLCNLVSILQASQQQTCSAKQSRTRSEADCGAPYGLSSRSPRATACCTTHHLTYTDLKEGTKCTNSLTSGGPLRAHVIAHNHQAGLLWQHQRAGEYLASAGPLPRHTKAQMPKEVAQATIQVE